MSPQPSEVGFAREAERVLGNLRLALARLIAAIPGAEPIRKPTELANALDIRSTLAWQVFGVAQANEPLIEAGKIPGKEARTRFFAAAASRGAPQESITAAAAAFSAFDDLVARHSGDRDSFASMISGLADQPDRQLDLQARRAAFKANSHILGCRMRAWLNCAIIRPSGAELIDIAAIAGGVDVRRLRTHARPIRHSWRVSATKSGADGPPIEFEPIDPAEHGAAGPALLQEFCSRPLPEPHRVVHDGSLSFTEFRAPGIGKSAAMTYMVGNLMRGIPSPFTEQHPVYRGFVRAHNPAEVFVADVIVQRGFFPRQSPDLRVYTDVGATLYPYANRDDDLLPMQETAIYLGSGVEVLQTPDVPRYPEMAGYVFDRLGWDAREFETYRCRMRYPVVPSTVMMAFDLASK